MSDVATALLQLTGRTEPAADPALAAVKLARASLDALVLRLGQSIDAKVTAQLAGGLTQLSAGDESFVLKLETPLPVNTAVTLKIAPTPTGQPAVTVAVQPPPAAAQPAPPALQPLPLLSQPVTAAPASPASVPPAAPQPLAFAPSPNSAAAIPSGVPLPVSPATAAAPPTVVPQVQPPPGATLPPGIAAPAELPAMPAQPAAQPSPLAAQPAPIMPSPAPVATVAASPSPALPVTVPLPPVPVAAAAQPASGPATLPVPPTPSAAPAAQLTPAPTLVPQPAPTSATPSPMPVAPAGAAPTVAPSPAPAVSPSSTSQGPPPSGATASPQPVVLAPPPRPAQSTPTPPPLAQILADPVQAAARQDSILPLIARLATLAAPTATALPRPALEAIAMLLGSRLDLNRAPPDGKAIREAVLRAGVISEPGGRTSADAKSALLQLRSALAGFLGGEVEAVAPVTRRPPPPLRGEPVRFPSAQPLSPLPEEPPEAARQLLGHADAALSRAKLLQLASSPGDAARPGSVAPAAEFRVEVPMQLGAETGILQLLVERDGKHKRTPAERGWRLRFALNFAATGEVGAEVALLGHSANVTLWAADPATAEALQAMLPELGPALARHGVDLGAVRVRRGVPQPANRAPGQLLDRAR